MLTSLAGGDLLADKTGSSPARVVALHGWARCRVSGTGEWSRAHGGASCEACASA